MGESITDAEIETARADMRAAIEARGLSVAEAARQSSIANSTLSAWLGGKYAGDNGRIAQQARLWIAHQAEQAQHRAAMAVLPEFVATQTATSILNILMFAQTVPDIVLITGGAGIGKTSALEQYQRTHPSVWMHTAEPAGASINALMEGICAAVGVREPMPSRRSATLMERVRGSGGLLIVDEAQHLSSGALDQLRTIHDLTKIGVAVAGNSEVFARIDGDGRKGLFAQFRSRIGMRLTRGKPLAADVEAMLDASGVTGAGERRLLRVVANKPGALRGVSKTLRVAHILAAGEGVPMTEAHLRAAAERLSHDGLNTEGV